jgi:hypothetical protein
MKMIPKKGPLLIVSPHTTKIQGFLASKQNKKHLHVLDTCNMQTNMSTWAPLNRVLMPHDDPQRDNEHHAVPPKWDN